MTRSNNRLARFFVVLAIMVALLNSTAASPLYAVYRARWSLDAFTISAIFAVYAAGTLIALIVLGRLADRLPDRRYVIGGSLLIVMAGALTFGFAGDLSHLMLGRFLAGAGTGGLAGAANAALVELDPRLDTRRAAMFATSSFTAGCALGPAISAACLALDLDPLRLPFLVIAALAVIALIGLASAPWQAPRALPEGPPESVVPTMNAAAQPPRLPAFAIAASAVVIAWSVGSVFAALGPSFAHELLGVRSIAAAGLVVTVFQLVGGISQMLFGRAESARALIVGTALTAVAVAVSAVAIEFTAPLVFLAGIVLLGIGYGGGFVGAAGVVNRVAPPDRRASFVSAFYVTAYLANCLPVLLLGRLGDVLGLAGAFLVLTTFAILAALALVPAAIIVLTPFSRRPRPAV